MGIKMGLSVACLFVGDSEELMLSQFNGTRPLLCYRYIDDVLGAATSSRAGLELQNFIDCTILASIIPIM